MARSCAICGKVSMGGFNPQSSGMNRVRAHRRMKPNLQPLVIDAEGPADQVAGLHPLPPHAAQVGRSSGSVMSTAVRQSSAASDRSSRDRSLRRSHGHGGRTTLRAPGIPAI